MAVRSSHKIYLGLATLYERFIRTMHRRFPEFHREILPVSATDQVQSYFREVAVAAQRCPYQPKFSVVIPVYKVAPDLLRETLASVASQAYPNWEMCIVDDASGDPRLTEVVRSFAARYPGQVHHAVSERNLHISETSNRALALATGDFVALLDHDDVLLPQALAEMVRQINWHDGPDILYSDERVVGEDGHQLHGAFYKPDWSPLLHLSVNYTTHLSVYRRELLTRIGGFRKGFEGSQDHDLMLRAVEASTKAVVHVPFVLYQWRAGRGSTAASIDEKPYAVDAGIKAVTEACLRRGRPAQVEWERKTLHYRVAFDLPDPLPLISIVIPTRNRRDLLERCIKSIAEESTYPAFELLVVDNGSTDGDALAYLQELEATPLRAGVTCRVLRDPRPFNFGAMNNLAAEAARGDYLVLLNNDTQVRTPAWLEELLRYAQLPEVGAVGCKLLYSDGTIQHAGLLLMDRKIAGHALRTLPAETDAYISMANTVHESAAVTAACMMVQRSKFLAVGGFDAVHLPNGYGDVDLCLKLAREGWTSVYTPYAVLTHFESRSRGRSLEFFEELVMLRRWGSQLLNDPYLNPNLERQEHYQLAPHRVSLDLDRATLWAYWRATLDQGLLPAHIGQGDAGRPGPDRH